jgi:hypothetical protein
MTTETGFDADRMNKRERARKLIRDLMAKTTDNGCTEQEAAKAAAKASELMAQYDLTMADAQEVRDDVYGARKRSYRNNDHEIVKFCAGAIAKFCDCRSYSAKDYVCMFGQQHDTEIAHYLLDVVMNAANAEWKRFYKAQGRATPKARRGFMLGFAKRINARLTEIKKERSAGVPTGTSLVVVKEQVVAERYAAHTATMRFSRSRSIRSAGDAGAYIAGDMAGRRVNITTGINTGSSTAKLE